ncbi:TonB-dependent receptor [Cellvibrio sp. pealriver]|uniref:TonB-dependent receptor n=1 Tax=Cellvibrio sp. pealriver TaxID=1622269 RepID=UPI00066FD5DF|nr:TonB-dependent receptor [Cellvibrio sp. pealriver]
MRSYLQDGNYKTSTFTNTLGGDHQLTEWKLNWRLNYTETESDVSLPIVLQDQTNPLQMHSLSYDRSNPNMPRVQLYTTVSNGAGGYMRGEAVSRMNQTGFGANNLLNYLINLTTESVTAKTDAEHEWQMGNADAKLSLGVQLDQRDAGSPGSSSALVPVGQLAQANGLTLSPNDFVSDNIWKTDFDRGFNATYVDNIGFRRQLDSVMDSLISAGKVDPKSFYPAETRYDINEDVLSAYAMNRWQWNEQEIVVGLRVEKTELDSQGFFKDNNSTTNIELSNSDTQVFPSIHWNMDLTEAMKIRFAAVTGTSRPNFTDLRAGAVANDTAQTVGGGNPYLNPEMAKGIDGSWEWYFTDAALASIGVFYRQVDDVLYDATTKVGDDRFNSAGIDRSNYDYATVLNGDEGEISGVEFAYMHQWEFLPEPLQGFGMQANLALLDSEFTTPDGRKSAFTGTSDKVINASVFYENYGWSVQLNWQWRDAWLDDISADATSDYYWKDTERLDLSVRYQLNDTIGFYLDANNLSDEIGVRYQGTEALPVEVEGFGRRYLLGVRASF